MTIWILRCVSCNNIKEINVGYNLLEFKQLYLYCSSCKKNTFHKVVKAKE